MAGFLEQEYYCLSPSPIFKGFDRICKTWFEVIKDYSGICENKDAIYWYNERASLSSFCAALGRRGITFMEEYSSVKGRMENEGKKSTLSRGRVDLCFFHNDSWYISEAKYFQRFFESNGRLEPALLPNAVFEEACRDAESSQKGYPDGHALGLAFVTLGFQPKLHDNMDNLLAEFILTLKDLSGCDFWAYCAPKGLRELASGGWRYPIVLLLGKIVREAGKA